MSTVSRIEVAAAYKRESDGSVTAADSVAQRRTKIVATLGPASNSRSVVRQLLLAGVDVFRLNLSHGTHSEHVSRIMDIRKAAEECRRCPGILLDLQGPKIRLGEFSSSKVLLKAGAAFRIRADSTIGNGRCASTSYPGLCKDISVNARILIADGSVELVARKVSRAFVDCEVVCGGHISAHKGLNVPGTLLRLPALTDKDLGDLSFGLEYGVDMIALSFVHRKQDVLRLRRIVRSKRSGLPIIAKIETLAAWERIDDILPVCDGVMVARGDLGVEVSFEDVPYIQKQIIQKARRMGAFVIIATQMLESMKEHPFATRAEVSDVANAVYEQTDALMLTGETAEGKYPVEVAKVASKIVHATEDKVPPMEIPGNSATVEDPSTDVIAKVASLAADFAGAKAIAVFTTSGRTAQLIARQRPRVPIFAFTTEAVARRLSIWYAVRPIIAPSLGSMEEITSFISRSLAALPEIGVGAHIILVAADEISRPEGANLLKIHTVSLTADEEGRES